MLVDEICQFFAVDRNVLQNMMKIVQLQHQMIIKPAPPVSRLEACRGIDFA